jgi:hypothetical protein
MNFSPTGFDKKRPRPSRRRLRDFATDCFPNEKLLELDATGPDSSDQIPFLGENSGGSGVWSS